VASTRSAWLLGAGAGGAGRDACTASLSVLQLRICFGLAKAGHGVAAAPHCRGVSAPWTIASISDCNGIQALLDA